jgi:hypothetical protein
MFISTQSDNHLKFRGNTFSLPWNNLLGSMCLTRIGGGSCLAFGAKQTGIGGFSSFSQQHEQIRNYIFLSFLFLKALGTVDNCQTI